MRPKRDLGQNFLVDSNILGVIERAAELGADDVVLEIGGGLGVLSEHLAARAAPRARRRARPRARAGAARTRSRRIRTRRCTSPTRCELDLAALTRAPTKVVANLPYGIAASAILRTIEELHGVTRWVAMVQKEVGERLAAAPGTPAYGVPSRARAARLRRARRAPVSRTVFHPVPNVDSVLVRLDRTGPAPSRRAARARPRGVRPPAQGARALARARPGAGPRRARPRARARCSELGHPADERAERLAPEEFRALRGGALA